MGCAPGSPAAVTPHPTSRSSEVPERSGALRCGRPALRPAHVLPADRADLRESRRGRAALGCVVAIVGEDAEKGVTEYTADRHVHVLDVSDESPPSGCGLDVEAVFGWPVQ